MISCLIIDDEEKGRSNIKMFIEKYCPDLKIVGLADGVASAYELISVKNPQLLFLDIEMKDGTGFDLLQKCSSYQFEVIFVTAYDQYGLHAIRCSAIDYLLKPIDEEDLIRAVMKAKTQIELKRENNRLRNLLYNTSQNDSNKKIALPFVDSIEFVEIDKIIHLQADGSYTKFFIEDKKELIVSNSLKEYDEMLSQYGFLRTHQAHLVNPKYIKSFIKTDGGYLKMQNGKSVPVSRLRKNGVMESLKRNV